MKPTLQLLLCWLLLLLFSVGCDDGPAAAPCRDVTCSGVGTCAVVGGVATCDCPAGTATSGTECLATPCQDLACAFGTCEVQGQSAACTCDPGYAGALCDACDVGYHTENMACVADTACGDLVCVHGACSLAGASPECVCQTGFAGTLCDQCAAGFTPQGERCVGASACDPDPCIYGVCKDNNGVAACTCEPKYTGAYCDSCAEGYWPSGLQCLEGPPCNLVEFAYVDPTATSVWVTGSFTSWAATPAGGAIELSDDGAGNWTGSTTIEPGGQHTYKFIVDGTDWVYDPSNPLKVDDGFGGSNSIVEVCSTGPSTPCNEITFTFQDTAASTVWVTGTFSAWGVTPAAGALELVAGSGGSWSLTTVITPDGNHQYKYIVDGTDWRIDPTHPTVDDGTGNLNNALVVCDGGPVTTTCGDVTAFDWRDAVMYFVMVDRFYDSDAQRDTVSGAEDGPGNGSSAQYMGGDLAGVTAKLGYLSDLGVTALWLTAPYENRDSAGKGMGADSHYYSAYHGYWPSPANTDFDAAGGPAPRPAVESRLGDEADLRALVSAAHAATSANDDGIKVLFDYVMNHVDIESGLYQSHNDWFARRNGSFALCGDGLWDDPYWSQRCAFTDYLPPFDFDNAAARAWSVADALWWATEFGVDGYRLDAIKHVPLSWLVDLRARLNSDITTPAGDRFYLVGETFDYGNRDLLKSFVNPDTLLDGQFDFPFKAQICGAVFTGGGRLDTFSNWMDGNDGFYGQRALMTTWIGNHDIPRPIHFASHQIGNCMEGSSGNTWDSGRFPQPADAPPYERLGVVFGIMMSSPGIPLIYYGDEVGLAGGGDPDNRRMMVWDDTALNSYQKALRAQVRAMANARADNKALSRGRRTTLSSDQDTWVYRMGSCGVDTPDILVAINKGDGARDVQVPAGTYDELLGGGTVPGGTLNLPARSVRYLRAQ